MYEKIQMKLEVMKAWANVASTVEGYKDDITENINNLKESLNELEAIPAEERDWRYDSYKRQVVEYERRLKAFNQVQEQIFKLMG